MAPPQGTRLYIALPTNWRVMRRLTVCSAALFDDHSPDGERGLHAQDMPFQITSSLNGLVNILKT